MNLFSKKIISFFLLMAIFILPFSPILGIKKAEAQFGGGAGGQINIQGIGSIGVQAATCVVQNKLKKKAAEKEKSKDSIEGEVKEGSEIANSVPVYSASTNAKLDSIFTTTNSTKKNTDELELKENCLDGIAWGMAKLALQKVTIGIVNWINTGNAGNPFFIENPESFFKNIARDEILGLRNELENQDLFPFGKQFMLTVARGYQNRFQQNATYSLNRLIQKTTPGYSSASFAANFNAGGWNAWLAQTQIDANNPMGFNIMASNELAIRLDGTFTNKANQFKQDLMQGEGFLGFTRCVDPKEEIDQYIHRKALEENDIANICRRWETATPGKIISEMTVFTANSGMRQIEMADELNESLAAITDALLNKFVTEITSSKGWKGLTGENDNISITNTTSDGLFNTSDLPPLYQTENSWFGQNPNFDITKDLTQAFIDEQRTYIQKLGEQNVELNKLITNIYQLDYCIPGPNPEWETTSRNNLDALLEPLSDRVAEAETTLAEGAAAISPSAEFIQQMAVRTRLRERYRDFLNSVLGMTGGQHNGVDKDGYHETKIQIINIMDYIFEQYTNRINNKYNLGNLPAVTSKAFDEFRNINGYNQMIEKNKSEINFKESIVKKLEAYKIQVDNLNSQLNTNTINETIYDSEIKDILNAFARITPDLVDGDDVAIADDLLKQIKDRISYIYEDLLTGPGGCESETSGIQRRSYPYQILYTYPGNTSTTFLPGQGMGDTVCPSPSDYRIDTSGRIATKGACGKVETLEDYLGVY